MTSNSPLLRLSPQSKADRLGVILSGVHTRGYARLTSDENSISIDLSDNTTILDALSEAIDIALDSQRVLIPSDNKKEVKEYKPLSADGVLYLRWDAKYDPIYLIGDDQKEATEAELVWPADSVVGLNLSLVARSYVNKFDQLVNCFNVYPRTLWLQHEGDRVAAARKAFDVFNDDSVEVIK